MSESEKGITCHGSAPAGPLAHLDDKYWEHLRNAVVGDSALQHIIDILRVQLKDAKELYYIKGFQEAAKTMREVADRCRKRGEVGEDSFTNAAIIFEGHVKSLLDLYNERKQNEYR